MNVRVPEDGALIVFSTVPTSSYASTGVTYRVRHSGPRTIYVQRADGSSGTFDATWAYAGAVWSVAL
jgi:hypothetical protein